MKKYILSFLIVTSVVFAGCLDTTEEIVMNEDGSGNITITNDMSAALSMAKQLGENEEDMSQGDEKVDTTISLAKEIDEKKDYSEQEKAWLRNGKLRLQMNMQEEKMIISMNFPFSHPSEIAGIKALSSKILSDKMGDPDAGGMGIPGLEDAPTPSSFDDYFVTSFTQDLIERKVNTEKYAGAQNDEYLKSMREMAGMGAPMMTTYIINLPRAVKNADGKSVKLSEDKKTVTVHVSVDDFFSDPSTLEFRIEY